MRQGRGLPCESVLVPAPFFLATQLLARLSLSLPLCKMAVISEASEFVIGGAWGPKRRCWDIVNKHAYSILLRW